MNLEILEQLNDLKEKGVITQEEFNTQKEFLLTTNSKHPKENIKNIIISFVVGLLVIAMLVFVNLSNVYSSLSFNEINQKILVGRKNHDLFSNSNTYGFQKLLEKGIAEHLEVFFADNKNATYTGNVFDYIDSTPIPLPETKILFTEQGVCFSYKKYEIAAGYLGEISFTVSYNEVAPFLKSDLIVKSKR